MQVSGILALSTRFLPTIMNILKKLAEEGQVQPTVPQTNQQPPMNVQTLRRDSQRKVPVSNPVPDASSSSSTRSSLAESAEFPATSNMVEADTAASCTS